MKGITHKQAIQWIHRRSDGLLNESQLSALEEHLRSCDPCHAYAANLDGLSAHLQNEFHRRWDEEPGPSQNVMAHVTAKAKRIPMTNQIFSAAKLLAGAMALIVVAFAINFVVSRLQSTSPVTSTTETVDNVSRAEDRLLAFTSDQNGNSDIYTIHADGSGMTNITNNPAYDGFPFWSPDGKRIAFISNRDSSAQIYLMNADGSNVIQVTNGEGNYGFDGNGHTPWSPDGRNLIAFHASLGAQNGNLYVIDINEKTITTLTHEPGSYMHPSWSLDGNYIAFTADTGRTPKDLFIVGSDGNHLTKLTENLSNGEFFMFDYEWSPNGMSLFFTTNRNQQAFQDATYTSTLYEASMDGSMAVAAKATDRPIMSWWNGIAVRRESEPRLSWLRPDGSQSMLDLCPDNGQLFGTAHKRSYNGNLVVGSNCSDSGWMLYWANQDGTMIHPLLNSPISTSQDNLFQMTWSPDDQYIAFVGLNTAPPDVTETLYVLDVAKAREDPAVQPLKMKNSFGPSWQPVVIQEIVEEKPTPAPPASDRLIAFTAEQSGNSDIYTMRADGGEMANITNDPANDYSPLWSPDGKRIGFVSERNGNTDIFVMDSNGRNLRQLTDNPGYDGFFSWSPDGEKIAYLSSSGNDSNMAQLTVMNADGGDKTSLTDSGSYIFLGWSPDGEKLVYQKQDPEMIQNNEIHVSDVNGMNHYEWIAIIDEIKWQDEEHFIGHGWSGASEPPSWKIYRFDANGMDPIEIAVHDARIAALFQNTYIVEGVTELSWYSANGGPTLLGSENFNAHCQERGDRFLQETRHAISPDGAHAFVAVYCVEGRLWFYYENAEGSEFKQLTDFSVADPSQVLDGAWSPDGKYFILAIANRAGGNADLYLFDIEKMLTDPSTQPMRLTADEALKYEIVWQPELNNEVVEQELTATPTPALSEKLPPLGTGKENGEWIAFIGAKTVSDPASTALTDSRDVYLIHPNGSGLVNLTNSPDFYYWPTWSPNGENLLFLRDAGTIEILRKIESNSFEVLISTEMKEVNGQLEIPGKPFEYSWSPNSEQIAYLDHRDGNYDIYTIYADGRSDPQPKQLTNDPDEEFGFVWSPDGSQIAYQKTGNDQLSVMMMDADGSNQHEVARGAGELRLRWSLDGKSIYASSTYGPPYGLLACKECVTEPGIYKIDLDEPSVDQIYFEEDAEYGWVLYDTPQYGLYFTRMHFDELGMGMRGIWKYWDGSSIHEIGAMDPRQTCKTTAGNILNEHIAPKERFSIITNFCAGGFDLYLADREAVTPEERLTHLLRLPLDTLGVGANEAYLPMIWSPDGHILIYSDDRGVTYFLDIERALQDPNTALTRFMEPVYYTGSDGLQYQSSETITVWDLVWQPAP